MDTAVLFAVDFFLKHNRKKRKIMIGAVLLSLLEIVVLLLLKNYTLYLLLTTLMFVPVTILAVFGWSGGKNWMENCLVSYLMMWLLGGIREWVWEKSYLSRGGVLEYAIVLGVFLAMIYVLSQKRTYGSHEYEVYLKQEGHGIWLKGYLDSGNQLRDIYTGKIVHIITEKKLKELIPEKELSTRLVPFTSLGKTDGWIRVVTVDEMLVQSAGKSEKLTEVAVGIAEKGELMGMPFDMILHSESLKEGQKG